MQQRFLTGTQVYDTYSGVLGTIQAMDLSSNAVPVLSPLYTGPYFVVALSRNTNPLQTFTPDGRTIDLTTGDVAPGITLVTQSEYTAMLAAGYPKT
jgi:hypothetical protein